MLKIIIGNKTTINDLIVRLIPNNILAIFGGINCPNSIINEIIIARMMGMRRNIICTLMNEHDKIVKNLR